MKTILLALSVLSGLYCPAGEPEPHHPYRKVGDKYYNLQPLYDWNKFWNLSDLQRSKLSPKELDRKRPMTAWIGTHGDYIGIATCYRVAGVFSDGLLIDQAQFSTHNSNPFEYGNPFFLTNYPAFKQMSDRKPIEFFALRTGTYQYTDAIGAHHTVDLYDYGTPYDPFKLAAQRKTNSIALNPQH